MSVGLARNGSSRPTLGSPDMPSGPSELVPGAEHSPRLSSFGANGLAVTVFDAPATGWPRSARRRRRTTSASIVSSSVASNARGEPAAAGASSSGMPRLRRTLRPPDSIPSRPWRICSNGRVPNLNRHRGFGRNAVPVQRVANRGPLYHIGNVWSVAILSNPVAYPVGSVFDSLARFASHLRSRPRPLGHCAESDCPAFTLGRVPRLGTETCVSKDICFGMPD
jgi:hypothetical protein